VYEWGKNLFRAVLSNPFFVRVPWPTPVAALRGVHVSSVAAGGLRNHAVAETGELWTWGYEGDGIEGNNISPLGHGEHKDDPLLTPI
jgi:alpha-tubulin suppressor-like RCC1 family protein